MRTCSKCKVAKDESDFYKDVKRKSRCISCRQLIAVEWRAKNRQKIRDYENLKYKSDSEYAEYRKNNSKEYQASNKSNPSFKAKKAHKEALRRSSKLDATPKWLSEKQIEDIQNFYWLCSDLKATSGQNYQVDHIIPLKGKGVCGLHVPWNLQVLPEDLNRIKHNSYL